MSDTKRQFSVTKSLHLKNWTELKRWFIRFLGRKVHNPPSPLKPKTLGSQIKTSPVKSMFYGTFSIYPVDNRKTFKCPLQTKFRYYIEHRWCKNGTICVTYWTSSVNFLISPIAAKWQNSRIQRICADFPLRIRYLFMQKRTFTFLVKQYCQTAVWQM